MRNFIYERANDLADAVRLGVETGQGQTDAPVQYLAGGTTLVDLMKLDVIRPRRVIDLMPMHENLNGIDVTPNGLRLGAFATMSKVAMHPEVKTVYPALADSLLTAASPQLRNMATLGGNVLQRTRCPYFRDPSWEACNKRKPGSGCAAITGMNRNHAVLGIDRSCISQYPGDFGIALITFDAELELHGPQGKRRLAFSALHRSPHGEPHLETTLKPGEIITAFRIPAGAWTRRSQYIKIRDRASYEFAIASVAVALELNGKTVRSARIGIGGMAYRPWRASEAEALLVGKPLTEANAERAAAAAFSKAVTHGHNAYKPELGRRTLVRALLQTLTMATNLEA